MKLNGILCLNYGTNALGAWYEIPTVAYDTAVLNPRELVLSDDSGNTLFSSLDSSPMVSLLHGSLDTTSILQTFGGRYINSAEPEPTTEAVLNALLGVKE